MYVAERAGLADVVILDVSPRTVVDGVPVDGLEICRRLADPETRKVPILPATAHAMKGSREFLAESERTTASRSQS